jgi:hypothetical protein
MVSCISFLALFFEAELMHPAGPILETYHQHQSNLTVKFEHLFVLMARATNLLAALKTSSQEWRQRSCASKARYMLLDSTSMQEKYVSTDLCRWRSLRNHPLFKLVTHPRLLFCVGDWRCRPCLGKLSSLQSSYRHPLVTAQVLAISVALSQMKSFIQDSKANNDMEWHCVVPTCLRT